MMIGVFEFVLKFQFVKILFCQKFFDLFQLLTRFFDIIENYREIHFPISFVKIFDVIFHPYLPPAQTQLWLRCWLLWQSNFQKPCNKLPRQFRCGQHPFAMNKNRLIFRILNNLQNLKISESFALNQLLRCGLRNLIPNCSAISFPVSLFRRDHEN